MQAAKTGLSVRLPSYMFASLLAKFLKLRAQVQEKQDREAHEKGLDRMHDDRVRS